MIHRIYCEWRKVFTLSATFLLAVFLIVSCKKQTTTVGSTGIDEAGLLAAGAVDTFTLETYSILDDSINTKNPRANVLGEMNDPVFGKINSSFYTQVRLNAVSPAFGDTADIVMDSVVLAMQFSNYTGEFTAQTFEVYELADPIDSDTAVKYYEFDSIQTKPGNLVEVGAGTIKPEPIADAIIDTVSVAPQMRIRLDTTFAKELMGEAETNPSSFSSNENFLDYFKGLYITTNNPTLSSGQGGVFGFNMSSGASKVTIYYKKLETINGVPTFVTKSYDFVITSASQSFNRVVIDRTGVSGADVQNVLNNKSEGLTEFYCQAFGLRAVVNIPGLSGIPANAVIHKAILNLPIQYQTGSNLSPGSSVRLFEKPTETSNLGADIATATVSNFTKSVQQDISPFVQRIVSGITENRPIYIAPDQINSSGHRIIFNGSNTTNKVRPKLYIIYTEF